MSEQVYSSRRDRIRADMETLKAMWKQYHHVDISLAITQMHEWSLGRPFIEYPNMQKLSDKFPLVQDARDYEERSEHKTYQQDADEQREQLLKDGYVKYNGEQQ